MNMTIQSVPQRLRAVARDGLTFAARLAGAFGTAFIEIPPGALLH
jgi:hypothetical protein